MITPASTPTAALCGLTDWVKVVPVSTGLLVEIYRVKSGPVALHRLLPILASAGLLVERETTVPCSDVASSVIQTVHCALSVPDSDTDSEARAELEQLIELALDDAYPVDGFNSLITTSGLTLQEVWLVRALAAWAVQQHPILTIPDILRVLCAPASRQGMLALVMLFKARLQPTWPTDNSADSRDATARLCTTVLEKTRAATTLAADDALWALLTALVQHTTRTNYWSLKTPTEALAFKLDSAACAALPTPKPWREIFVHHATVEGVHLRGGPVARGGLRYSDRAADYRTEVLGLLLAQMRKNTIIAPVGAKGGFIVHGDASASGVQAAYRMYIRALLSITDNQTAAGTVIHPEGVLCTDGEDPYLVVAADKGTAKFSDLANDESVNADFWGAKHQGFWLGDAFASGGSAGYDHKGMGITAKGAWISVLHHLNTLGLTPSAKTPVTVAGIGDMGGDVFGNGLLRSKHVQLIAAFNHAHIFIDPTPDPAKTFAERQRCFDAGLGWGGYDTKKLSEGGAIYSRLDKKITLSKAAQAALGTSTATFTPEALIRTILAAPVDVLWNGGIGTYIKASSESHADAADKANNEERVNASAVRAKVIGEGGNLGITPAGRVELALHGVRLNTDALDNSAGVNTSDVEVNLKIALAPLTASGSLKPAARKTFLHKLTPQVEAVVLGNNRLQNLALTLEEHASPAEHAELLRWQNTLMERGVLDAAVDHLPTAEALAKRPDGRFVRPELAALLAGTKATLKTQLQTPEAADILASTPVQALFDAYFPDDVKKLCGKNLAKHPLANTLKATLLAGQLANRLGVGFGANIGADFGVQPLDIMRAAVVAIDVLQLNDLWAELDAAGLPVAVQSTVIWRTRTVAAAVVAWVLRHGAPFDVQALVNELSPQVAGLSSKMNALLPPAALAEFDARLASWKKLGLPAALAQRIALLSPLSAAPDVVRIATRTKQPLPATMALYLAIGDTLSIPLLVRTSRNLPMPDGWTRMAVQASVQELSIRQRALTTSLLQLSGKGSTPLDAWKNSHAAGLLRYQDFLHRFMAEERPSVAMLNVMVARLRELEP